MQLHRQGVRNGADVFALPRGGLGGGSLGRSRTGRLTGATVGRILDSVKSLLRRPPVAEEQPAPRFVVSVPARLLTSLSHAGGPGKVVAATVNISASGLAILVPNLYVGTRPVGEGSELKITLDLHPLGTVEMKGLVVRVETAGEGERTGHVLGVRITRMGEGDRARSRA